MKKNQYFLSVNSSLIIWCEGNTFIWWKCFKLNVIFCVQTFLLWSNIVSSIKSVVLFCSLTFAMVLRAYISIVASDTHCQSNFRLLRKIWLTWCFLSQSTNCHMFILYHFFYIYIKLNYMRFLNLFSVCIYMYII